MQFLWIYQNSKKNLWPRNPSYQNLSYVTIPLHRNIHIIMFTTALCLVVKCLSVVDHFNKYSVSISWVKPSHQKEWGRFRYTDLERNPRCIVSRKSQIKEKYICLTPLVREKIVYEYTYMKGSSLFFFKVMSEWFPLMESTPVVQWSRTLCSG